MPASLSWLLFSLCLWLASLSSGALWSYGSAFVVLVGVVGETITELTEWIKPEADRKKIAKISAIVLILGLTGDLLAIRETQIEVASLTKEAGDARKSAERAASAADRANASADEAKQKTNALSEQADALSFRMEAASGKLSVLEKNTAEQGPRAKLLVKAAPELAWKLAPFARQHVELFICGQPGQPDQETTDAWAAIANILGTATVLGVTGAKWNLLPTNLYFADNCGAARGLGLGVNVFVSKRSSGTTTKAADVLGHELAKTLPPSPNEMPARVDPAFAKLLVSKGFDKNAPWIAPGLDSDLITVLIGAHP
jgi:hypothetical protein